MADTAMDVHEQGESKAKEKSEQAKKNKKKSKQVITPVIKSLHCV